MNKAQLLPICWGCHPEGVMCRVAGQQCVQGERSSAEEPGLPQKGSWGLIDEKELTSGTRQERSSRITVMIIIAYRVSLHQAMC